MENNRSPLTRVGITGAAGHIGTTLVKGLPPHYTLTLYDRRVVPQDHGRQACPVLIDLSDPEEVPGAFNGLDALIHLAADARPGAPWESVLNNNIIVTYNVFEESRRAGVRRIIFASTNHVLHGYTMGPNPEALDLSFYTEGRIPATLDLAPAPDSLYAVSKLFGEDLGRYYARRFGMQFVALRIGWTVREDDPSIKRGTPAEDYMRAMFLSRRDCAAAFTRALEKQMGEGEFLLAFAISNNDRRVFDLEETRGRLGFNPLDNAEAYFK